LSFGFAESIAGEAREADKIKNETPIMVLLGIRHIVENHQIKGSMHLG